MSLLGGFLGKAGRAARSREEPRFSKVHETREESVSSSKRPLNPKLAGNFLIYQLILSEDSKFGLTRAEIDEIGSELPLPIRDLFSVWADLYSAWMFRLGAGVTYGREFQVEMMAHAFARIENSMGILTNTQDFIGPVRTFFSLLDDAMMNHHESPPEFEGKELPFCICVAGELLLKTEGSPYFNNQDAFDGSAMLALGVALERIENHARSYAPAALKKTAESLEEI